MCPMEKKMEINEYNIIKFFKNDSSTNINVMKDYIKNHPPINIYPMSNEIFSQLILLYLNGFKFTMDVEYILLYVYEQKYVDLLFFTIEQMRWYKLNRCF